jgi:hypothetical protein
MESVSFITAKNGVITGYHSGNLDADLFGTPYYGHDRIQMPDGAMVSTGDSVDYYDTDWKRKSDFQLIDEGLMAMPEGYVIEGEALRKMTNEEKIIAGLTPPPAGMKVEDGVLIPQTLEEKLAAELITGEKYLDLKTAQAQADLDGRLAALSTEEAKAMAEVDPEYAAERKTKIAALLAVKQQPEWPLNIQWPEE